MPTLLVTGANRGLGLGFVRSYAAEGWRIHAAVRDPAKAEELSKITGVQLYRCDVTDLQSVRRMADDLKLTPIDLLICNAGVYLDEDSVIQDLGISAWEESFRVNAQAPIFISQALRHNVTLSEKKLMVFITSRMGSLALNDGKSYAYRASKAALNMAVRCLAIDLAPEGVTCLLLNPGWVRTEMGGGAAPLTIPNSISAMRKTIDAVTPVHTGKFFNFDGEILPW